MLGGLVRGRSEQVVDRDDLLDGLHAREHGASAGRYSVSTTSTFAPEWSQT